MTDWDIEAFWSYVHQDDEDDGGRIVSLARLLAARLRLRTGRDAHIFVDKDLTWGDDWEPEIDAQLLATKFFVPIVTPSFFRSPPCREEVLKFTASAKRLGLTELVMPLYYVTVPEIEAGEPSGDEVIEIIKRFQWEDWREAALEDSSSAMFRKRLDDLATALIQRGHTADAKPTLLPGETYRRAGGEEPDGDSGPSPRSPGPDLGDGSGGAAVTPSYDETEDETPGVLEVLAEGEEAMTRLNVTMTEIPHIMTKITAITERHAKGLSGESTSGQKLAVARRLAKDLQEPAEGLEALAEKYLEDLVDVRSMIDMMLTLIEEQGPEDREDAREPLQAIRGMTVASDQAFRSFESLATTLHENGRWSKDLRRPLRRIEVAIRQMADSRTFFAAWQRRIDAIFVPSA